MMLNKKQIKVSIITPCFNAENYIRETIESVLSQTAVLSGRVDLEYIVVDGASKDATVSVVSEYAGRGVKLISEADKGMYDALRKGFQMVSGDYVAYINAGDYYHKTAFDVVCDVFEDASVSWLMGSYVFYNNNSQVIGKKLPFRFKRQFLVSAIYGRILPAVQQESCFWRCSLFELVDFERFANLRLAGDAYLWSCFASKYELFVVEAYISGFKFHPGQLSESQNIYLSEIASFSQKLTALQRFLAFLELFGWLMSDGIKRVLGRKNRRSYDLEHACWMEVGGLSAQLSRVKYYLFRIFSA